jgi:sugar lactone lactonase YvrE
MHRRSHRVSRLFRSRPGLLSAVIPATTLAALLLGSTPAMAVSTQFFRHNTAEDFSSGRLDKATLSSLGMVQSGMDTWRASVPAGLVWSAAEGSDGTWYLGSGNGGDIYALRGNRVVPFSKVDGVLVTSLVVVGQRLYAGTMPAGKVYEIPLGGNVSQARLVTQLPAEHVWTLHPAGNTLYAATGPRGQLFAIDLSSRKAQVVYDSGEKHILTMTAAPDGTLFLGTADKAVVLRYDPRTRKGFAMRDFEADEIRNLVMHQGSLFVTVNQFDRSRLIPAPATDASAARRSGPVGGDRSRPYANTSPLGTTERKGKGWLWRIDPDGRAERLLFLPSSYASALDVDAAGNAYVGTSTKGRVILVQPDRTIKTAFQLDERQVLALRMGKNPIMTTADSGAVYRVVGQHPRSATYTSRVLDASFNSHWGNLQWRGQGNVTFETRSGNTARPDKTWSGWQRLATGTPARVPSPPARFLQYRALWDRDPGARLREVTVYYLNQNQRPRVSSLSIGPAPARKGEEPVQGALKVTWSIDNPDGDDLVYRIYYRADDEPTWKLLTRPDPLTKREYIWNTQGVPQGIYRLKVVASDEKANPPGAALMHENISAPVLVDNAKPEIVGLKVQYPMVTGTARDGQSRISRLEYSVDGGEWVFIYPKDGIFDDRVEPFALKIGDKLPPGQHSVAIKAWDAAGNIGANQILFMTR